MSGDSIGWRPPSSEPHRGNVAGWWGSAGTRSKLVHVASPPGCAGARSTAVGCQAEPVLQPGAEPGGTLRFPGARRRVLTRVSAGSACLRSLHRAPGISEPRRCLTPPLRCLDYRRRRSRPAWPAAPPQAARPGPASRCASVFASSGSLVWWGVPRGYLNPSAGNPGTDPSGGREPDPTATTPELRESGRRLAPRSCS